MGKYELYVVDTETTGLSLHHDIIELSLYRLSNNEQKTWCIKPIRTDNIEADALRVNGHKLEDLLHQTKDGRERYIPAAKAVAEVENWLMEDYHSSEERLLVGHNVNGFDKDRIIALWDKCKAIETFPFSKRYALDTMQTQVLLDIVGITEQTEYYNLKSLVEKYGIKKEKLHAAASDTRMTKDVFLAQVNMLQKATKK